MGLQENFQKDTVAKLDIRDPVTVLPTASLQDAMTAMRETDLGCVVVVDADQKPIGMFTESMLTELLAHGKLDPAANIAEFVAVRYPWIKKTDKIYDLLEAMQLKNVRIMVVLDDDDRVVGLTGQRGLMEYIADHYPDEVMVQRVGQHPYLSSREGA